MSQERVSFYYQTRKQEKLRKSSFLTPFSASKNLYFCQHIPEMVVQFAKTFFFSLHTEWTNVWNRRIKHFLSSFKKTLILGLCYISVLANSFWLLLNYSFCMIICKSASFPWGSNFALVTGHTSVNMLNYSSLALSRYTHYSS